jgi:2-polyprenyl-6-methoxyphenol hydroxylase-like FAD-dependent oxidoreductase
VKPLEIAVAGCGPAGLAAALMLARDGHRVTLFERFATPRPIGSGLMLQPAGLAVLRAVGLRDAALAAGARIERLRGETAGGRVTLDVRYSALRRPGAFGLGIHRAALFGILFEAVRAAGIPIETDRTVAGSELVSGDRRELVFADGRRAGPFDLVAGALGASTPLAPPAGRSLPYGALWASLDWPESAGFDGAALEQRYAGAHTMAGVMPIGRAPGFSNSQAAFFWSLREDRLETWRREGLDAWKAKAAALWPRTAALLGPIDSAERLTFARYRHRTLTAPASRGLIHIGDAWRSTSPQLGQGANMALLDAYALAAALRATPDVASALARAVETRKAHVAIYQGMSRMFTPVYQSDSRVLPFLRDRLAGPLARRWPATAILATIVAGYVGAPLRRLGLSE